jgi:hypothetical protein
MSDKTTTTSVLNNLKYDYKRILIGMNHYIIILIRMNNYIMPLALSDIKTLHVTYYGWHDLPQGLWIINEYINECKWTLFYYCQARIDFGNIWTNYTCNGNLKSCHCRPSPIKLISFICHIFFEIGLVFSFALRTINRHWWSERQIRGRCCTYIVVKLWHTG